MSTLVKTIAILVARPGRAPDLKALLFDMAPHCRAESGNLRWDLWQDQSDLGRFVIDEMYKDAGAVTAHRETPHYMNYRGKINDLADRTVIMLDAVDIA